MHSTPGCSPRFSRTAFTRFLSESDQAGTDKLNKISQSAEENDRSYRDFNFFDPEDEAVFEALGAGEFNISGIQNKDLRRRVKATKVLTGLPHIKKS